MGDWDYINEHMGGHDADGMPNFVHGFSDEEEKIQYVDKSPYRPVEKYSCWRDRYDVICSVHTLP